MSTITRTSFLRRILGPTQSIGSPVDTAALTLRYAGPADSGALETLAELDSQRAPRGAVLVAEVGGEIWAAISVDDSHAVADPFRPTGELVALLVERVRQLRRKQRGRLEALPRVWPEAGYDRAALS